MNILLLYISPNKTTEKISRALASRLTGDGHAVTLLDIGKRVNGEFPHDDPGFFQGFDLIGIGSPVFHMRILEPMQAFLESALPLGGPQPRAFIYLTYGGITTGKAFANTARLLKQRQIALVGAMKVWAPHFYDHTPYPDPAALATLDQFCSQLASNRYAELAWDRVDSLFSTRRWRVKAIYPFTEWIGRLRELPIQFDAEKCVRCKRCVNECPSGAIEFNPVPVRDARKCIHCYHCTLACPKQAVVCPTEKVEAMVRRNKKTIGCEQPANAVYF